jgi:hypothetical protein
VAGLEGSFGPVFMRSGLDLAEGNMVFEVRTEGLVNFMVDFESSLGPEFMSSGLGLAGGNMSFEVNTV